MALCNIYMCARALYIRKYARACVRPINIVRRSIGSGENSARCNRIPSTAVTESKRLPTAFVLIKERARLIRFLRENNGAPPT